MNPFYFYLIIGIYILFLLYLGYKGSQHTISLIDYFIASQNINPYVMSFSYVATFVSSSAIIGYAGISAIYGFPMYYLLFLTIFIGIFVSFVFFGKRIRSLSVLLEAHTIPELLGKRFQSRFIQFFSGLILILGIPLYAAVITLAASYILKDFMHIDIHTSIVIITLLIAMFIIAGGIRSVMYTDTFQGLIMFFGMLLFLILLFVSINSFGGFGKAVQYLHALEKYVPKSIYSLGFNGWTNFPAYNSPMWWILISSIIAGVGIGVLAQPHLLIRFMTIKSNKEINRGVIVGAIFMLIVVGTAFTSGIFSNVLLFEKTGKLAIQIAEKNVDRIIPALVKQILPSWFQYIFLITVLAAAISTLTSLFHVFGTVLSNDIVGKARKNLLLTKISVAIGIFITMIISFVLPTNIVAIATSLFFSTVGGILLPLIICALFVKIVTKTAIKATTIVLFIITIFHLFFIHRVEAVGIGLSNLIFNKPNILINSILQYVDIIFINLPLSFFLIVTLTILTRPYDYEFISYCFEGMKVEKDKFILEKKAKILLSNLEKNIDQIEQDILETERIIKDNDTTSS